MIPNPSLELRDLRLIRAIVSSKTATAAAKQLGLSQSAVSHQLRNLEERLELVVFERAGRGLRITELGERLLTLSHDVLERVAALEAELRSGAPANQLSLRVATQCFTAYHWLPKVMQEFSRLHANVQLQLVPQATRAPLQALKNDELDLALSIGSTKDRAFCQRTLFSDELVLVVAPAHPLAQERHVTGRQLENEPLFVYEFAGSSTTQVRELLFPSGGSLRQVTRLPLTEAIVEVVRAGLGVSILPAWSVEPYVRRHELACVRLGRAGIVRKWVGSYRRDSKLVGPIRTLLNVLKASGGPAPRKT